MHVLLQKMPATRPHKQHRNLHGMTTCNAGTHAVQLWPIGLYARRVGETKPFNTIGLFEGHQEVSSADGSGVTIIMHPN